MRFVSRTAYGTTGLAISLRSIRSANPFYIVKSPFPHYSLQLQILPTPIPLTLFLLNTMQIIIKSSSDSKLSLVLSDERRSLANFLSILKSDSVSELEIVDYKDSKIPKSLQSFNNLTSLSFRRCHNILSFPKEIASCPSLKKLAFFQCADFHSLDGVSLCSSLETLHVSRCDAFDDIPQELTLLHNLRALDFSYCEQISFIDFACLPPSLRLLDMHGCFRASFDDLQAQNLRLVSLMIQDASNDLDKMDAIDDIVPLLHHMMSLRDGCALDN